MAQKNEEWNGMEEKIRETDPRIYRNLVSDEAGSQIIWGIMDVLMNGYIVNVCSHLREDKN